MPTNQIPWSNKNPISTSNSVSKCGTEDSEQMKPTQKSACSMLFVYTESQNLIMISVRNQDIDKYGGRI